MNTVEMLLNKFKEKGIEVIVYEDEIQGELDCIVDTTRHDKQVRENAIDECIEIIIRHFNLTQKNPDGIVKHLKWVKENN